MLVSFMYLLYFFCDFDDDNYNANCYDDYNVVHKISNIHDFFNDNNIIFKKNVTKKRLKIWVLKNYFKYLNVY